MDSLSSRVIDHIIFFFFKNEFIITFNFLVFMIINAYLIYTSDMNLSISIAEEIKEMGATGLLSVFFGSTLVVIGLDRYFYNKDQRSS